MATAHYEIVEHDGGWAYRLAQPKQLLSVPPPSRSGPANPRTSNLKTVRADGIPSTRLAMTGLIRMLPSSPEAGQPKLSHGSARIAPREPGRPSLALVLCIVICFAEKGKSESKDALRGMTSPYGVTAFEAFILFT